MNVEDPVGAGHLRLHVRDNPVPRSDLLHLQRPRKADPFHHRFAGVRRKGDILRGEVYARDLRLLPIVPVYVYEAAVPHGGVGHQEGDARTRGFLPGGFFRVGKGPCVESAGLPFFDPDHRFFEDQIRDFHPAAQEGQQPHPYPERFHRRQVGLPIPK